MKNPAAPIAIEVPASHAAERQAAWFEISQRDLHVWSDVLLGTNAALYQYPFWNEPCRPLFLIPRYLAWGTADRPTAYVCILTIGFRPAKIGLVFRGPVRLQDQEDLSDTALLSLLDWARLEGYVFIRFTHSDPEILGRIATLNEHRDYDAFPYFLDYSVISPDFVVDQDESEDLTLARFSREARRKIRRAAEIGYEFRSDSSPEALAQLWPLYRECSRRKHFRLERPLSVYMEAMRLAQPHDCARLYSAYLDGTAVGSTLVFRDGNTAHSLLAAFDAEHRHSAVFLHWHSMRDMYRLGTHRYNLGPGPRSLGRFKQQFTHPQPLNPAPLTVVFRHDLFQLWEKAIYPIAKCSRPLLRSIVSHVRR